MDGSGHFKLQARGDVTIVHLLDQKLYDVLVVSELEDELLEYIVQQKPTKVLINFGPVLLCATPAINLMLRAKSRLLSHDGQLKICGMNEEVRAEFQMLNLDGTVFDIYDHAAEALAAFSPGEQA